MVRWLAYGRINPNYLTLIGVSINVACGLLFGLGFFFWAGIILIIANLFDMLDGQVARLSGRVTRSEDSWIRRWIACPTWSFLSD